MNWYNRSSEPQMLGDLPLVGYNHFYNMGSEYWKRECNLDAWDAASCMERLQKLLHQMGPDAEKSSIALASDYLVRWKRATNSGSAWGWRRRWVRCHEYKKYPYHVDILPRWEAFAEAMRGRDDIKTFQISNVALPPTSFFAEKLMPALENNNDGIVSLELCNCSLVSGDLALVADFLTDNASLVSVGLAGNKMDNVDDAKFLALAIWNHPGLASVDVSSCGLGANVDALSAILDGSENLKSLILESNDIASSPEGVALVADFLAKNSSATVLGLGDNALGAVHSTALCKALKKNADARIEQLSLRSNGITKPSFLVSNRLAGLLHSLDLSGNGIRTEGSKAIAEFLSLDPILSELTLEQNNLPSGAAKRIAEAMKSNTHLQHLNLKDNSFTDKSVPHFVELLKNNSTLLSLDLSKNNFKVATGRKPLIRQALCDPTSFETIANSNHTCKVTFIDRRYSDTYEIELRNINGLDESEGVKIRYKVVLALFTMNGGVEHDPRSFDNLPLELMPRALELITQELGYNGFGKGVVDSTRKRRGAKGDPGLRRLFEVIRGWPSMPLFFVRGPGKLRKKRNKRKRTEEEEDGDWKPSSRLSADSMGTLSSVSSLRSRKVD